MSRHSFTAEQSIQAMDLLAQSFIIYPIPDVEPPDASKMGQFLLQHPQYVYGGAYDSIAMHLALDKGLIDVLTPDRQGLATSLIATILSEQDLKSIAGIN